MRGGTAIELPLLTGCDITSKMGTKHAAKKADPSVYLGQFGKQINEDELFDVMLQAEHYLTKVLKQGTPCTTMDGIRYWQNDHSKNKTIQQLPSTLQETRLLHIMRYISEISEQ